LSDGVLNPTFSTEVNDMKVEDKTIEMATAEAEGLRKEFDEKYDKVMTDAQFDSLVRTCGRWSYCNRVQPYIGGDNCIMVACNTEGSDPKEMPAMWIGIEEDGHAHS
jgi:hypothetical protein